MKLKNKTGGMSLIEILVVVGIFSILGVLTTRSVILSIGGGKKTETLIKVRENVNYAMGVIERQLRNANSISDCTNNDTLRIDYLDSNGQAAYFSCNNIGTNGFVASGSASIKLTSDTVKVTSCSFECKTGNPGVPSSVKVSLEATDKDAIGITNATVSSTNEVFLRNY